MKQKADDMDIKFKILKILEKSPNINQRQMAERLGLSLGKTHYVIKALIDRGAIKITNFKRSKYKSGYAYYLTKKGLSEKTDLGVAFLARKQDEYQRLKEEISKLESEVLEDKTIDSTKESK